MIARAWLAALLALLVVVILGGLSAPILAAAGQHEAAETLYAMYAYTCHQWASRSFFVFGNQLVYDHEHLTALGLDAYRTIGAPGLGWKMAFCERDLAIYIGLLLAGGWFARRRDTLRPLGLALYALLILPMAIDGGTQLLGWRESTWQLRLATGLLFGVASGWLLYPRIDRFVGVPSLVCAPQPRRG